MSFIPTFGPRRSPQASEQPSGKREEIVQRVWTFLSGIRTQSLYLLSGELGGILQLGPNGLVSARKTINDNITFSDSLTVNGSDFTVEVDDLSLIGTDTTRNLIGDSALAGFPVFVGQDPPAVASARLGKVDLTAQVVDITTTALSNTPPAGVYEVEVYLMCTTADALAGSLTVTIGWTDNVGATTDATTITAFPLTATGRTRAVYAPLRVASGNITYAVAVTGIYGTAAYAVYARVVALG